MNEGRRGRILRFPPPRRNPRYTPLWQATEVPSRTYVPTAKQLWMACCGWNLLLPPVGNPWHGYDGWRGYGNTIPKSPAGLFPACYRYQKKTLKFELTWCKFEEKQNSRKWKVTTIRILRDVQYPSVIRFNEIWLRRNIKKYSSFSWNHINHIPYGTEQNLNFLNLSKTIGVFIAQNYIIGKYAYQAKNHHTGHHTVKSLSSTWKFLNLNSFCSAYSYKLII